MRETSCSERFTLWPFKRMVSNSNRVCLSGKGIWSEFRCAKQYINATRESANHRIVQFKRTICRSDDQNSLLSIPHRSFLSLPIRCCSVQLNHEFCFQSAASLVLILTISNPGLDAIGYLRAVKIESISSIKMIAGWFFEATLRH